MKAYVLTRYGGPECAVMQDLPQPVAGPGEVLVAVRAAGLNPVDFKTRDGMLKAVIAYRLPQVMGNELAGVVVAVGPGVARFAVGDWVFARTAKDRMGAFAEMAVVNADLLALIPPALSFTQAAAIPLAGLTALQALRDELHLQPGMRVLIPGGAGGVGTFAIQLARWLGAHVITTASPRGRALVERLGADEVIDYTTQTIAGQAGEVDAVFDLIGGKTLTEAMAVLRKGGTVVSVAGMPEPQTARKDLQAGPAKALLFGLVSLPQRFAAWRHGVRYRFLFMHPSGPELAELGALADAGKLEPVIDRVFPFAETAQAMAYLEGGRAKGKVVLEMDA